MQLLRRGLRHEGAIPRRQHSASMCLTAVSGCVQCMRGIWSLPAKLLSNRCSDRRPGKAPGRPQAAGRLPDSPSCSSQRIKSCGKAPGAPHASGRSPENLFENLQRAVEMISIGGPLSTNALDKQGWCMLLACGYSLKHACTTQRTQGTLHILNFVCRQVLSRSGKPGIVYNFALVAL